MVEKCGYPTNEEKERHQLELLFHATKHFEVKKWVRLQTALKETVTFEKLLQHAKQHEATIKDFHRHKSNGGVATSTHNQRDSEPSQEKVKDLGPEPVPGVRVRYVVSVGHLIHQDNAPHMAKSVTNVEIRIILVLNVGPNSQEEGTDGPAAHPEDIRAKANINNPGREVTRQPKVHIAWSQPLFQDHLTPFKTIQVTLIEIVQTSMDNREARQETSMEPKVLNS